MRKSVFMIAGMALLISCSAPLWQVRDRDGQALSMGDPRFVPSDKLLILVGNATRELEARQIAWMEIDPTKLKVQEALVYYGARLILQDGTHLPDSSATDSLQGVWIPVDGRLVGDVRANRMEIPLAYLRSFETNEWMVSHPKDSLQTPDTKSTLSSSGAKAQSASSDSKVLTDQAASVPPDSAKETPKDSTQTATPDSSQAKAPADSTVGQ
ncbi:MAG TPA: hypothetical protein VLM37_00350 [Fibrobacteraceae bacterium]|nr:hypothetical protein [Fibrobacteraceae bacterium]